MTVLFASLSARIAMVFGLALAVISVAMLSEYWGGLIPCALCLKQRVAFFVAVVNITSVLFTAFVLICSSIDVSRCRRRFQYSISDVGPAVSLFSQRWVSSSSRKCSVCSSHSSSRQSTS